MAPLGKHDVAKLPDSAVRNDNFLQRSFVTYTYRMIGRGRTGVLKQDELKMPADQATEVTFMRFQVAWAAEIERAAAAKPGKDGKPIQPSLWKALWKAFGMEFIIAGCWKITWSALVILGAFYFVRSLVSFSNNPARPFVTRTEFNCNKERFNVTSNKIECENLGPDGKGVGWILASTFFIDSYLVGFALQRLGDCSVRLGIKIRSALMTEVYRKTFRLREQHSQDGANVVSLVATDCAKLYEGVLHFHNVWTAPLESATIIGLLLGLAGIYGLPALAVLFFVLPLQYYFGYRIAVHKSAAAEVSDARVLRMHEILLAIKLVKFYVWERPFAKQVAAVREEEVRLMHKAGFVKTLNLCLVFWTPPVIALVIFGAYVSSVDRLRPEFAFVVLSLFNTLRFPLVVLPKALRGSSEAVAAVRRLNQFLLQAEGMANERAKKVGILMKEAVLVHPSNPKDFTLNVPEFSVEPGQVVAVVGRVGVGKSSVLHAILSNMKLQTGSLTVGGNIAYVPQMPWVQNLSLRENILFGLPFDEAKYKEVVHVCALELDMEILPKGDRTLAGERGINLSGGQRQRVCLARAVYHDCDIVLLDNPLSAVDQHTSTHIFNKCIKGVLKEKAVILIAHQLELLPQCDRVAIMDDGKVVYFGPYDPEAMREYLPADTTMHATVEGGESATAKASADEDSHESSGDKREAAAQDALKKVATKEAAKQRKAAEDLALAETPEQIASQFKGTTTQLTSWKAAMVHIRAAGVWLFLGSMLLFAGTQTLRIISDLWIRFWAADTYLLIPKLGKNEGNNQYLFGYLGFVLAFFVLLLTRDSVFEHFKNRAATKLHNDMFDRVLRAPYLLFLRTPVGEILNSFAKDQYIIDEELPDTVHMATIYLMILITSLAIITASIYFYAIMSFVLFFAFWIALRIYLPAATVLKRWSGETATSVFVHVDETLSGIDVIRAFDAVGYFMQENVQRINLHHLAMFNTEMTHLFLAFWCDLLGAILVVVTCLLSVALREELGAAAVGLAISNSIQVLVFFTWVVRGVADSVSRFDAVERITTFATQVPTEDVAIEIAATPKRSGLGSLIRRRKKDVDVVFTGVVAVSAEDEAPGGRVAVEKTTTRQGLWPSSGAIKFEDVCLRYFPGAPLALRHVSFTIADAEKVGVVGRTGSGKTTMLMALFRMFKLAKGRILVDSVDISSLPLELVRSSIAIIPQEPVMFKGTVRSNLDPFGELSDADLWEALSLVSLRKSISEMPGGLDAHVADGGCNFSLGQKQLFCMARCVLKKTRVLVLDEATAAMDLHTDALIQKTIRRVFRERTTITIAHRLDTIIFSDKILTMADGHVIEFDPPSELLNNPDSMFCKLVNDTGPYASAALRAMAEQGPKDEDDKIDVKKTPPLVRRMKSPRHSKEHLEELEEQSATHRNASLSFADSPRSNAMGNAAMSVQ